MTRSTSIEFIHSNKQSGKGIVIFVVKGQEQESNVYLKNI